MVIRCCKKCAYEVLSGSQASLDSFIGPCVHGHDFTNANDTDENKVTLEKINENVEKTNENVGMICDSFAMPKAISNTSDRNFHQEIFKDEMLTYYDCRHPTDINMAKCLVLNRFFPKNKVIAAHIVSLEEQDKILFVGLKPSDIWNKRNGLLLWEPIEKAFNSLDLAIIWDDNQKAFVINVLYDDLLNKNIERKNPTTNIKYKDIHGKVLVIPPTSPPFRRAIYWKGKGAYHYALCDTSRPTLLSAKATEPDWDEIAQKGREESTENTYVFDNFLKI